MRLIDADKIEYTHAIARCIEDGHNWNELCVTKDDIEEEPTVDAVPVVHGHWKYDNQYHWYRACCSECGYCRVTDVEADRWNEWKYCPNCGARMDEE